MADIDHMLHTATKAADVLKEQLREIAGDDVDVIRDTLEGEIDLRGLICLAAEQNALDVAQVNGIATLIDDLRARKDRIENRIGMRRAAILAAMASGEIKTLETPAGTISRKAVPPSVLILDEAAIPSDYWKPSDPKLDKKAVGEALKAGREVPGAQMNNGGETISIRV
ncbi:MAG: hypothetical protein RLZZ104_2044 [Pseudomonadota bacterium]|jgi:hypothetical protein